jgi:branched-chain amino acid transport system substrate-binding protein
LSKKLLRVLTLLVGLSMLAAACGGTPGTDTETEDEAATGTATEAGTEAAAGSCEEGNYKIAYQGPLTGDFAALGENMVRGIELAINEAADSGDLGEGVTVELARFDSQGNPDQAPPLAQQAVADESIVAMVGPAFSGETNAAGCPSCRRRRPTPS